MGLTDPVKIARECNSEVELFLREFVPEVSASSAASKGR